MRNSLQDVIYSRLLKAPWYKKMETLRVIYGWTMKEASEKCGIGLRIYWNWENGKSTPIKNNRKIIAEAFNVLEEDMFRENDAWSAPRR